MLKIAEFILNFLFAVGDGALRSFYLKKYVKIQLLDHSDYGDNL